MLAGIWKAFLLLLGITSKGEDIVKTNQANAKTELDQRQGEQNANSKTTAAALTAVINADDAAHNSAVLGSVRDEFKRP